MSLLVQFGDTVASVLAQNPEPPAGQGEEFGKASPIALVVILCLAVATIALVVSMTRRIRRLPESFEKDSDPTLEEHASEPSDRRD